MLNRQEWLQQRRLGIGGSDVAAILGISRWKTPLDVYLDKIGEAEEQPDNAAMQFGRLLEPVLLTLYAEQSGQALVEVPPSMHHVKHSFMMASLDGLTASGRVVEIKTARWSDGWGEPGTDEIPDYYTSQVQHYLAVTAKPVADVAVLIGGSDFRIYTVEADQELQALLIEQEAAFWQRVQDRNPPEPVSESDLIRIYPKSLKSAIETTPEISSKISSLASLKANIKELDHEADAIKLALQHIIGDHGGITMDGKPLVTWKAAKDSAKTDWQAVALVLSGYVDAERFSLMIEGNTQIIPGSRRFLLK